MDEGASASAQSLHLELKFQVNSRGLEALRVHVLHHKPPHQEPLSAVSSFYPSTGSSGSVLREPHPQLCPVLHLVSLRWTRENCLKTSVRGLGLLGKEP